MACLLALATAIFYGLALGRQPIGPDEARVVSQAQRPIQGLPPVLINAGDRWLQPLNVYATKIAHLVQPGFFAGRWASVIVAAISVGLLFMVGWRLFGGYIAALAAALALIFLPAHMTFGRQGIEAIYVVPFVVIWLYALGGFIEKDLAVANRRSVGSARCRRLFDHCSASDNGVPVAADDRGAVDGPAAEVLNPGGRGGKLHHDAGATRDLVRPASGHVHRDLRQLGDSSGAYS